jgi:hypothetical protein
MGARGSLFDRDESGMAFMKNLRHSIMRHPRMIKEEPLMEQRQQLRFTSQFRSTFSGEQREGQGRTLDLSTGGCKIEADLPVVMGDVFEFRIYVPGLDWPLRIDEAQVRWVKAGTFGVQFTKIRPDEAGKLYQVIANLNEELDA